MLEPYVLKGTRTVLRRGETSNCLFLFDVISSPHPHKKNIDTNPLNVQFIPGLKKPENSCTIKLNFLLITIFKVFWLNPETNVTPSSFSINGIVLVREFTFQKINLGKS